VLLQVTKLLLFSYTNPLSLLSFLLKYMTSMTCKDIAYKLKSKIVLIPFSTFSDNI